MQPAPRLPAQPLLANGVSRRLHCFAAHAVTPSNLPYGASLVAELVKNSPAMWETWFQYLGWEDPLEKGTATHSNILAWRILWTA